MCGLGVSTYPTKHPPSPNFLTCILVHLHQLSVPFVLAGHGDDDEPRSPSIYSILKIYVGCAGSGRYPVGKLHPNDTSKFELQVDKTNEPFRRCAAVENNKHGHMMIIKTQHYLVTR